jgi:hypothetical protein
MAYLRSAASVTSTFVTCTMGMMGRGPSFEICLSLLRHVSPGKICSWEDHRGAHSPQLVADLGDFDARVSQQVGSPPSGDGQFRREDIDGQLAGIEDVHSYRPPGRVPGEHARLGPYADLADLFSEPVLAERAELDEGEREGEAGEYGADRCYGCPRHGVMVVEAGGRSAWFDRFGVFGIAAILLARRWRLRDCDARQPCRCPDSSSQQRGADTLVFHW